MLEKIKKIDGVIVVILVLLMVVSITSIYSVTNGREGFNGFHIQMLKYYGVGFIAFIGLSFIDYRLLLKNALYIYLLGIGLLVLVSFTLKMAPRAGWIFPAVSVFSLLSCLNSY